MERDGELTEFKGDRMPIGPQEGTTAGFIPTVIPVLPGDRFFIFTDGLQDQFGGPQGKKLKSSGLKQWITETSILPIDDQYQAISDRFRLWKGNEEQVDDILLIGIQV